MKKYFSKILGIIFFAVSVIHSQSLMSGSFSSGGEISSNNDYSLNQVIGQTFVGITSNSNYTISSGTVYNFKGMVTGVNDNQYFGIPDNYSISQNYPNPFNPSTKINYALPKSSLVKIKVFDVLGREVINLINEEQTAGYHEVVFNASSLPSGVYFYNILAENFAQTKKMILMK